MKFNVEMTASKILAYLYALGATAGLLMDKLTSSDFIIALGIAASLVVNKQYQDRKKKNDGKE